MSQLVRDAYDARAAEYAAFAARDLERIPGDRVPLAAFARLVSRGAGAVADLGCGPGHIVDHLATLGVKAIGYDVAPRLLDEARRRFPGSEFRLGDVACRDVPDASLAGLVARYSLIHLDPSRLADVFAQWRRVLEPGAPVLVSFFAAGSRASHGRPFDHAVVTAHALFPETLVAELESVGFEGFEVTTRAPLDGERALDHGTILAVRDRG